MKAPKRLGDTIEGWGVATFAPDDYDDPDSPYHLLGTSISGCYPTREQAAELAAVMHGARHRHEPVWYQLTIAADAPLAEQKAER